MGSTIEQTGALGAIWLSLYIHIHIYYITKFLLFSFVLEILNFGPGTGLARAAMRALKERVPRAVAVSLNDVSSAAVKPTSSAKVTPTPVGGQEPIAIVGMAVNFPGARDTQELWNVLEKGINTVEEVRFWIFPPSSYFIRPL